MNYLIKCSEFVKRQTKDSGFSHFNGTWEELEFLVQYWFKENPYPPFTKQGYKDGVILQEVPPDFFYTSIVELNDQSKLIANYTPRVIGEAPFIRISSKSKKQKAKFVSIVLYRHDVLAEDNSRSADSEWEIIAIKARLTKEEEPMDPYTMARNFLHLKGGTKADFTAQQFAESIVYWNNHCMTTGRRSWFARLLNWFKGI